MFVKNKNMKNRIGEKWITNEGYNIKIIEYFGKNNCTIQFENNLILKNIQYWRIKTGNIKNLTHKSIYNVGYFGIGSYNSTHKGYGTWSTMLERCYNEIKKPKNQSYKDCSVHPDWHNFQVFAEWFDENYVEGYELDKDILVKGNKVYGPSTCCFVPKQINNLFTKRNKLRGDFPIGVNYHPVNKKFVARCNVYGCSEHLGYFDSPEQAFYIYKKTKEGEIKRVANEWKDKINQRVFEVMLKYEVEITD